MYITRRHPNGGVRDEFSSEGYPFRKELGKGQNHCGQAGHLAYSASDGATVDIMPLLARDFADDGIRVMMIASGILDASMVACFADHVPNFLIAPMPNPRRVGVPGEYGALVRHVIENRHLNNEGILLNDALLMHA